MCTVNIQSQIGLACLSSKLHLWTDYVTSKTQISCMKLYFYLIHIIYLKLYERKWSWITWKHLVIKTGKYHIMGVSVCRPSFSSSCTVKTFPLGDRRNDVSVGFALFPVWRSTFHPNTCQSPWWAVILPEAGNRLHRHQRLRKTNQTSSSKTEKFSSRL